MINPTQENVTDLNLAANIPQDVFGTSGNDVFDSEIPGDSQFIGDEQNLSTDTGNDTVDVTFAPGGNLIDLGSGNDLLFAGTNNRILAGSGDDILFVGSAGGNNVVTGGSGKDQFWVVTDSVDLPSEANTITDFEIGEDVIGLATTGLGFADLGLIQDGVNTIIQALGQDFAILFNTQASALSSTDFVFDNNSQSQDSQDIEESVNDDDSVIETPENDDFVIETPENDDFVIETPENNDFVIETPENGDPVLPTPPVVESPDNPNNSIESLSSEINEDVSLFPTEDEGEIFDLQDFADQVVSVDFVVTRSAEHNNYVGFYKIDDITGMVDGLTPGDEGYTEAALSRQVSDIKLQTTNEETLNFSTNLDGGDIYAPFIIVNDSPDSLSDLSSIYFPFLGANSDNKDRVRLLGENTFGFEDGTDFDYNDLIVQATFSVATVQLQGVAE